MWWIPILIVVGVVGIVAGGVAIYKYRVAVLTRETLEQIKRDIELQERIKGHSKFISNLYATGNYSNVNVGLYDKNNNEVARVEIEVEERVDISFNKKIYLTN